MTDTEIESYRYWLATMTNDKLDAEAANIIAQAVQGANVAVLMARLQAEYKTRGNLNGFIKVYNSVIQGMPKGMEGV